MFAQISFSYISTGGFFFFRLRNRGRRFRVNKATSLAAAICGAVYLCNFRVNANHPVTFHSPVIWPRAVPVLPLTPAVRHFLFVWFHTTRFVFHSYCIR